MAEEPRRTFFTYNITILFVLGYWCTDNKRLKPLYKIYQTAMIFFWIYLYNAAELINIIMNWGNIPYLAECSYTFISMCALLFKSLRLVQVDLIREVLDMLHEDIFKPRNAAQKSHVDRAVYLSNRDAIGFVEFCHLVIVMWAVFPQLETNKPDRPLPFEGWYPYDKLKSPMYEITYAHQILGIGYGASVNIGADTLITGLLAHSCAQFRILKDNLRNLKKYSEEAVDAILQGRKVSEAEYKILVEREFQILIVHCVQHHERILVFLTKLENFFSRIVFEQCIASAIVICITGIELTVLDPMSLKFVNTMFYMCCMLVQIFLYCWYGNEVYLESNSLTQAIYQSDWYTFPHKISKELIIMMERYKRPVQLRAERFFNLSVPSFVMLLRTSYSYFAVLSTLSSSDSNNLAFQNEF